MNKLFISTMCLALPMFISCSSVNPDRGTASSEVVTSDASGNPPMGHQAESLLSQKQACTPGFSDSPLEIYVNGEQDTLTLFRGGQMVEGYPILSLVSGFPSIDKQSPKLIKKAHYSKLAEFRNALIFNLKGKDYLIARSNVSNFTSWSDEKKLKYKDRGGGIIAVDPVKMKSLFYCINKFSTEQIKVTVN